MSTSGRKLEPEFGNKQLESKLTKVVREPLANEKSGKTSSGQKMTKSSSVSSFSSMSDTKDGVMDQDDILKLTQDVKHFSDGLAQLKTVFSESAGSEEDLKVHCHSKLGEVLAVLKNILNSYPALQSTELFAASGGLISKIKSYNYGGPKDTEAEHNLFESIDTLALAFSSSVSDYLMGDLDNSSSEKEKEDKTKSYDNLSSSPNTKTKAIESQNNQEYAILGPEEIDSILSRLQAGVDLALQRAKAWSKYMKDIASYIERKTHLESEFSKNIQRLAQGMRPVLTEEGFLPLQSVYCTVLSQDIEYANTCQATQVLLQTQKFVEPLTVRRAEHDKARKNIKDSWMKECKKMQDAVHSLRKAQNMYNTRQQEYDKARELACKTESDMLAQSSSGASSKVDKRKKLEEDAMHKAAEAETTYKACVAEANNRQQELENVKGELLAKVREQILQCDEVIRNVTVEYFHLLQTVTAPIPVQYHTLYETSKQYVPGVQYGEFVRRLSLTTSNLPTTPEQFTFEPYISSHPSPREIDNRKTSTQSTGSSSEMQSQDDSPQLINRKDRYRVKAWAQGLGPCSDTDSASGSSKSLESSPSNSPHPSGRRNLVKSGSLDDLEETNGAVPGNILQMPATDGVDLQGILQRHGRRRNTTFGVDFQEQVQHCKSAVPPIITKCLKEVEKRGMSMKGIYRVSGVKSKVEGLCSKFEKNPELVELCDEHPNVISNVLKLYLRQLPEPLFTFKLYSSFIQTAKENMAGSISMEDTVQRLGDLASKLPYSNFKTSAILMHHLHRVAANHEINQMTASNLGIVFGPTLLRPLEGTASLTSLVDTPHQTRAVELIIVNVHEILGPDREHELIPAETPIEQLPSDARGKVHTSSQPALTKEASSRMSKSSTSSTASQPSREEIFPPGGGLEAILPPKSSDAEFCLPGSAHTDKKDVSHSSPSVSEGDDPEEGTEINSDEELPDNLLPDLSQPSQHASSDMAEEESHVTSSSSDTPDQTNAESKDTSHTVSDDDLHALTSQLNTDPDKGDHPLRDYQWYNKPIREEIQRVRYPQVTTCKAVPPHQLYLAGDPSPTSQRKMLVPKITIIESSPITESKPQMCYPLKASDKHKPNKALHNLKSLGPSLQNFVINTAKGLVGKASFPSSKSDKSHESKEKKVKSSPPLLRHISADQLSFSAIKQALQRSPKLPRQSSLTEGIEISCPEPIVEEDEVGKQQTQEPSLPKSEKKDDIIEDSATHRSNPRLLLDATEGNDSLHLEIKSSPLPRRGTVPPSKASKSLGSSSYQGKKGFFTPPPSSKFTHDAFIKLSESYPNPRSSQSPQLVRKSPTPNLSPSILRTTSSYPSVAERQPYVPKFSPPVSRHSRVSFSLPEDSLSESESSLDSSHTSTMSSFSLGSPWSSPTISRPTLKRQNPVVSPPSKKAVFSYDPSLVRMRSSNSSLTSDTKSSKDEDISASSSLVNSSKGRLDSDESASGIEGKTTTRKPTTSVDTRGATTRECSTGTGAMAAETVTCTTDLMRNPVITSSSLLLSSLSPVLPRFHHTDKGQSPSSVAILSGNLPLRPTSSHQVMESISPGKGKDLKENIEEKLGAHTKSETNVDGPCVEAVSKEDSSGSKCSSVGNEESSRLTCSSSKILVGSESPQQPDGMVGSYLTLKVTDEKVQGTLPTMEVHRKADDGKEDKAMKEKQVNKLVPLRSVSSSKLDPPVCETISEGPVQVQTPITSMATKSPVVCDVSKPVDSQVNSKLHPSVYETPPDQDERRLQASMADVAPTTQAHIKPSQANIATPQALIEPPQVHIALPPQTQIEPPQVHIAPPPQTQIPKPPQTGIEPLQAGIEPLQAGIEPLQAHIAPPPQTQIPKPPQTGIEPLQARIEPLQARIEPLQAHIALPPQTRIEPAQARIEPLQAHIAPPPQTHIASPQVQIATPPQTKTVPPQAHVASPQTHIAPPQAHIAPPPQAHVAPPQQAYIAPPQVHKAPLTQVQTEPPQAHLASPPKPCSMGTVKVKEVSNKPGTSGTIPPSVTQHTKATRTAVKTSKASVSIDPTRAAKGPSGIVMGKSAIVPHRSGQRGVIIAKKPFTTLQGKREAPPTKAPPTNQSGKPVQSDTANPHSQTKKIQASVVERKKSLDPSVPSCATCGRRKSAGRILDDKKLSTMELQKKRRGSADDLLKSPSSTEQKKVATSGRVEGSKNYSDSYPSTRPPATRPLVSPQRKDRTPRFV